jgi:cytochrome c oxidase subunit 2
VLSLWRSGRAREDAPADLSSIRPARARPVPERALVGRVSIALLLVLVVASVVTDRALARMSLENAVNIEVTSHQWWWELRYGSDQPSETFTTAERAARPGRPPGGAQAQDRRRHPQPLGAEPRRQEGPDHGSDVDDAVPRRPRPAATAASAPEFCGFQHAFMAFEVIADPPDRYDAWVAAQRQPAAEPTDATARRGQEVFLRSACIMCHAIEGTSAGARKGPDLTHLGARTTIAAGTLPNRPAELARWIANPQDFKPGSNMPATTLSSEDMGALVAYLESLK